MNAMAIMEFRAIYSSIFKFSILSDLILFDFQYFFAFVSFADVTTKSTECFFMCATSNQ